MKESKIIKKAISEQGWGPLNRNLLLSKELLLTMTEADRETFKLPLNRPSEAVKDSNNFVSVG